MTLVDPPYVLEEGLIGQGPIAKIGSGGSISTLPIPEDEAAAAEKRRGPLGFSVPPPPTSFDRRVVAVVTAYGNRRAAKIERDLRDLGELLWTARDTVVVYSTSAGEVVGYPQEYP